MLDEINNGILLFFTYLLAKIRFQSLSPNKTCLEMKPSWDYLQNLHMEPKLTVAKQILPELK